MSITFSQITFQTQQQDGRIWVGERHVDNVGSTYDRVYLADVGMNVSDAMMAYATALSAQLGVNEINTNVAQALTNGKDAVLTFNYSTLANFVAAVKALTSLTIDQLISLGNYLMSRGSLQLATQFGFTAQQVLALTAGVNGEATAIATLSAAVAPLVTVIVT